MTYSDEKCCAVAPIDLVSTRFECWKCKKLTLVSCLTAQDIDDGYGTSDDRDGTDTNRKYRLTNIRQLPQVLFDALTARNRNIRLSDSRAPQDAYLANHCEHCNALQGDFFLHSEPDGPFFASHFSADTEIQRIADEGRFEVVGGYAN